MKRREFLKTGAAAGLAASMPYVLAADPLQEKARIGFIGVGLRGRSHLRNLLLRDDVIIPAICDIDPEAIGAAARMMSSHGPSSPRDSRRE